MSLKEEAIKKQLQEQDEDKQIKFIRKMSKRLSTPKLKKGYRRLKHSKKNADIKARMVMKEELNSRGIKV